MEEKVGGIFDRFDYFDLVGEFGVHGGRGLVVGLEVEAEGIEMGGGDEGLVVVGHKIIKGVELMRVEGDGWLLL